jgi:pyridoxamine 5'-phosphate oxidase
MKIKIADLRQDYLIESLDVSDVNANPFLQFEKWFNDALKSEILEPNAMTLATVSSEGKPSARVVLLKGLDTEGFVFYTNYESRKGQNMAQNPHVALCFNWLDLQRQIRIEGIVSKVSDEISTEYFNSRPKSSRIGAWSSPQSQIVENRAFLEEKYKELTQKYENTEGVPRPKFWGGYIVKPTMIEFWQGRSSRLHDRIVYEKTENGAWKIERLAP